MALARRQLGAQPIDLGLERPRVDLEQQVAARTIAPSVKRTAATKPDTRGRTATVLTASRRPVNSSHSVTSRDDDLGDGDLAAAAASAGCAAGCAQADSERASTRASQSEHRDGDMTRGFVTAERA